MGAFVPDQSELRKLLLEMEAKLPPSRIPLPPAGRCCYPKDTSSAIKYWCGDVEPDVVIQEKQL